MVHENVTSTEELLDPDISKRKKKKVEEGKTCYCHCNCNCIYLYVPYYTVHP